MIGLGWLKPAAQAVASIAGFCWDLFKRNNAPDMIANKEAGAVEKESTRIDQIETRAEAGDPKAQAKMRNELSEE